MLGCLALRMSIIVLSIVWVTGHVLRAEDLGEPAGR